MVNISSYRSQEKESKSGIVCTYYSVLGENVYRLGREISETNVTTKGQAEKQVLGQENSRDQDQECITLSEVSTLVTDHRAGALKKVFSVKKTKPKPNKQNTKE